MSYSVFEDAFKDIDGFPRPDWKFIRNWIAENVREDKRYEAWDAAAEIWLRKTKERLGEGYSIDVLNEFALLSALQEEDARALLHHAAAAKNSILSFLKHLPRPPQQGPHVIIVFRSVDDYCTYISYYDSDGIHALAPAECINRGYVHIVLAPKDAQVLQWETTHELTHLLLAHLQSPIWLQEGIAQVFDEALMYRPASRWGGSGSEIRAVRDVHRQRTYWRENGIQEFWSGCAFRSAEEARDLSYHLSEVLVRNLATDHPDEFLEFVRDARFSDAGESAMRRHLGISPSDCVTQFLGEGNWSPDPEGLGDYFEELDKSRPE